MILMWEKSLHSSLFYLDLCGIHFYFCHHRDWYSPVDIWMALYFWNHFVPYLIMWEKSLHSSLFYLDLCGIHFYFCHHRDWYSPVDIWMTLYFWNHFVPYFIRIMWEKLLHSSLFYLDLCGMANALTFAPFLFLSSPRLVFPCGYLDDIIFLDSFSSIFYSYYVGKVAAFIIILS